MLTIDGSSGEGGGQIVRSSVALSMVTGTPVTINRVRARRDKPGLKRQHLTAVRAAAEICGAQVDGAEIGSSRLVFMPGKIKSGDYHFRIGTAGSTTLVFQTVLPALLNAGGVSTVTLEGGTHNPFAPPFDFLDRSYLPLIEQMGMVARASLDRAGFFPAGGGKFSVAVEPISKFKRMDLLDRGKLIERRVRAIVANLPLHIGERECKTIARKSGWGDKCFSVEEIKDSPGPGNVVLIELRFKHVTEVFVGFGEKRQPAERVAMRVWQAAKRYVDADAPVGPYLADQLILPLAIGAYLHDGGGAFRTTELSQHASTHIEVVKQFMDIDIAVEPGDHDDHIVRIN